MDENRRQILHIAFGKKSLSWSNNVYSEKKDTLRHPMKISPALRLILQCTMMSGYYSYVKYHCYQLEIRLFF